MIKNYFGKVAVLYGGLSGEREVSLKSGRAVYDALLAAGVDVVAIDVGADLVQQLENVKPDRVFNVLHGPGGEDGDVPGLLNLLHIPYTGSGVLGSALAMDKVRSKALWSQQGLPVLPFAFVSSDLNAAHQQAEALGYPLCVKPIYQGSSLGVYRVNSPDLLSQALSRASIYGPLMMEPWIEGTECTVTILGDKTLPVIVIRSAETFYDFEAKYLSDKTQYECPAKLEEALTEEMQRVAMKAFKGLGCQGWGRVDFMLDQNKHMWILEVNTVPGMTDHSLVPMAAKAVGMDMPALCVKILEQTLMPREHFNGSAKQEGNDVMESELQYANG